MQTQMFRRVALVILGNVFIGLAVSLLRIANLGTDPFSTMNLGLSSTLNLSLGIFQVIINLVLFPLMIVYLRNSIGLGTIVNMFGIGFISDFFVYIYFNLFEQIPGLELRLIFMLVAVALTSLGVALYVTPDLGMAPYDALAFVIEKVSNGNIRFSIARMITDVSAVIIGFMFGAVVGVATVILAFFLGPFIQFFRVRVAEPLVHSKMPPITFTE
ncbi:YczE/YyaS/YitT family protein [Paraliobacillus ryukyuensis]|uniref:YczE/YyaS/YitT family protein n=1 Tax=Paraliobacillus ryukyuensis TaxID=200904 RepID=UPI0021188AD9|nr:membrane protein [Paraliobacillus ryukyuensis]